MIVRRFLLWAQHAAAGQRAEAAAALARAYLYSDLAAPERREVETALMALLDDASPLVRRSLAEAFANATSAPRLVVLALAGDRGDIAGLVLARSPVLRDEDLVDCVALGDAETHAAVAGRPSVSVGVAAALAEIAGPAALVLLLGNPEAEILPASLRRMLERHGEDGALREGLLGRADLPVEIRQAVAGRVATALSSFVTACGWLTRERSARVAQDARERTTLVLSTGSERDDLPTFAAHLRTSGQLTGTLILRAILGGRTAFAEAALADLADLPLSRAAALMHDRRGAGLRALCRRAGLPTALQAAIEGALSAHRDGTAGLAEAGPGLSRRMIERALTACEALPAEEARAILSLLVRFDAEAARDEAREIARSLSQEDAVAAVLDAVPSALLAQYCQERAEAA